MTRTLRTVLTVVLLATLLAGGMGTAAAEQTDIDSGCDTIVNDDDLVDADNVVNDINANVLGLQSDDSEIGQLTA
ncbi:hypothetical protein [Halocatena pleomorpha]|uniref:Uncharacterized protein n=1 Tax=Halocatena pleomorpha TaxID=1785090 RepID=A0A3P3R3U7_9EURY|nr:hypothetical protein [Halocatena pleomorpha]RRJ28147.1 hypothetical protein EIK79_16260 [Halocatena pleomorpha]